MSNKSSPRRRSVATKRYDEDYEYYAPVRNYGKTKNESSTAEESETSETPEVKRKRGRPPGNFNILFIYFFAMWIVFSNNYLTL